MNALTIGPANYTPSSRGALPEIHAHTPPEAEMALQEARRVGSSLLLGLRQYAKRGFKGSAE